MRLIADLGGLNVYGVSRRDGMAIASVEQQNFVYLSGWRSLDCSRFKYQLAEKIEMEVIKYCHNPQISEDEGEAEGVEEEDRGEGEAIGEGDSEESKEVARGEGEGEGESAEGEEEGGEPKEAEEEEKAGEAEEESYPWGVELEAIGGEQEFSSSSSSSGNLFCNCQSVWLVNHAFVHYYCK